MDVSEQWPAGIELDRNLHANSRGISPIGLSLPYFQSTSVDIYVNTYVLTYGAGAMILAP
jgi:hypothetical protein